MIYLHLLGTVLQNQMCQARQMLPSTCCKNSKCLDMLMDSKLTTALSRTEMNYVLKNNLFCRFQQISHYSCVPLIRSESNITFIRNKVHHIQIYSHNQLCQHLILCKLYAPILFCWLCIT